MEQTVKDKLGEVKIAREVFATIAGLSATEVKGVSGLAGGITHDMITHSGEKRLSRSVRVEIDENKNAIVYLALMLDGKAPIPEVTKNVREKVTNALESMTGTKVFDVKITIAEVSL